MSQRIFLILLTGLLWTEAVGQSGSSSPNPVAFGMIRATTEFLATDTKAFGNRTPVPCSPCQSYDDLYQFVRQNKLLKADELITEARNVANEALQTDSTQLPDKLRSFLMARVTANNHAYRTSLPAYETFVRSLGAPVTTAAAPLSEPTSAPEAGDLAPLDGTIDTTETITEPSLTSLPDQPTSAFSTMDYLPLFLSILSLAGVAVLWFRKSPTPSSQPMILPEDRFNKLEDRLTLLRNDNQRLQQQVETLRQMVDTPRPAAAQPQPANRPITQTTTAAARPAPQPTPQKTTPPAPVTPQPVAPTLLYGRTADLGDGFSTGGLSDKPDRDTIFEILRIEPTRAEFKVSDNPDLQRLALSDAYSYLNDTCTYATQPRPGNRIRTEKPGLLSLQGEKWVIAEKAQISFLS